MLGEYAQDMQDAPYILESLIENWDEEHSAEVAFLFNNSSLLNTTLDLLVIHYLHLLCLCV